MVDSFDYECGRFPWLVSCDEVKLLNYYLLFSRSRPLALGYEKSGTGAEQNIGSATRGYKAKFEGFLF